MNRAQIRSQWRAHFQGECSRRSIPSEATAAPAQTPTLRLNAPARTPSFAVRVHIEELELRGVGRLNQQRVATALQSDLRELVRARGIPANWGRSQILDRANALPPSRSTRVNASWLGAELAQTIYNLRSPER